MKIAVVGAGIGGLAFAALAAQAGRDVTLVERFHAPGPVGSGLVIQPVGLAVLDRIGAGEAARALGAPMTRMLGHAEGRRSPVLDVRYRPEAPGLALHRAALFSCLWQAAQAAAVPVVTDATVCAAPMQGAQRHLILTDGRQLGPFDLVVDASGAGSALSPLRARPLRYGAVWASLPWPDSSRLPPNHLPPDQLRQRYRGASRMMGILPIGRMAPGAPRLAALFWSLPVAEIPAFQAAGLPAWQAEARALWPEAEPFIQAVTDPGQFTPARYAHGTLRRPHVPALVQIGDAAHRASPQLGQGANMALLDALALALALEGKDPLATYAAMRRWHVRAYQGMSAAFTPMYQSGSRALPPLRDHLLAPLSRLPGMRHLLTALVSGDLLPPLAGERFP